MIGESPVRLSRFGIDENDVCSVNNLTVIGKSIIIKL
jgi:hypothetical protein